MFVAGEGRRFYGRTTTSAVPNKTAQTVRQPLGVAGLIIAANTPIANVAWKVFPALLCGNAAVLKPAEDTPLSAWAFARLAQEAGLPPGVLNVVHGLGEEAGAPLVESPEVDLISFTGSTAVGPLDRAGRGCAAGQGVPRAGREESADRLRRRRSRRAPRRPRSSPRSATPASAAPPEAGSSCSTRSTRRSASGCCARVAEAPGRLRRRGRLRTGDQRGPARGDVRRDRGRPARRRHGAHRRRAGSPARRTTAATSWRPRCWRTRTPESEISRTELFGPISVLYRVPDFEAALGLANDSPYGLTAAIHTANVHRAMTFAVPDPLRRRGGERRHLRQRAAPAVRRVWAIGHRLARGRDRGAGCVLGVEDGVPQLRPRGRSDAVTAPTCVALIPARAGLQAGRGEEHPAARRSSAAGLHASRAARESGVFAAVIVSTDAESDRGDRAALRRRGALPPAGGDGGRPLARHRLGALHAGRRWRGRGAPATASACCGRPARSAGRRPSAEPGARSSTRTGVDSLRAVEPCRQHPGKMWVAEGDRMRAAARRTARPIRRGTACRIRRCRRCYVQNASLEIAWCRTVSRDRHDRGRVRRARSSPKGTRDST